MLPAPTSAPASAPVLTTAAPPSTALLSVVIPTRDTRALTLRCLDRLLVESAPDLEVIVVDDASTDGTAGEIRRRFPTVEIIELSSPAGFTAAANRGLACAAGALIWLLNSDTEVATGAIDALRRAFAGDPRLGIAGGELVFPDGRAQWSGGTEPDLLWFFALGSGLPALLARLPGWRRLRPVSGTGGGAVEWVPGASLALRRQVLDEIGGLDPELALYAQDLDLCSRARDTGWRVGIARGCRVLHHLGATIGQQPGAVAGQRPALLARDLLRWAVKRRGPAWARRAAWALAAGTRLRLAGRRFVAPWLRPAERDAFRHTTAALHETLRWARGAGRDAAAGSGRGVSR